MDSWSRYPSILGVAIVVVAFCCVSSAQTRRALLVGINAYTPEEDARSGTRGLAHPITAPDKQAHRPDSRFAGTIAWPNLSGPENDVENLAAVLPDFGFTAIHRLLGQKATRQEILKELDQYLIQGPKPGDTVLFYFAGHGSQRLNSKSSKLDHLDETIVPADAFKGAFDIRDKELARKFNEAIDKGVHLIAIFDSCHSGTMARGVKIGRARWLPYDDRDAADGGDYGTGNSPHADPPAKRGAVIISAALSTQTADEIEDPVTGTAHGVFTSALIRALRSSTPAWTTLDLVNSTDAQLKADGWTQQPTVEGPANRPLFGEFTPSGIHATVVNLISPDQVTLNAGSAMGFGIGTEFENKSSPGLKLRVVEVTGAASSRARLVSGTIADVHPGDLFQMARLVVPPEAKLTVFIPAAAGTEDWNRIQDQVSKLHSGDSWKLVDDPVFELPSNLVFWSAGWMITEPRGESVSLGRDLTADAISRVVSNGATVYVSVPPTEALLDALQHQSAISSGVIDIGKSLATSQYILIGRLAHDTPGAAQYALALPGIFGALNSTTIVRNVADTNSITCSTDSELPLRTDWSGSAKNPEQIAGVAAELESAALKLGRDRAWLRTAAHNGSAFWPYRLTISAANSDQTLGDAPLVAGTAYEVKLEADPSELASHAVQPQYVYAFGLQCDGGGALLYPSSELGGGAPLPLLIEDEHGKRYPQTIKLTQLQVAPPLGLDTIVLLVTPERISDLGAFNYEGVVTSGTRGAGSELDDLVRGLSGQSRGLGAISATWSIQRVSIKSH